MTTLLTTAFEKASTLPEIEQNRFAEFILEELESERKWDHSFAESEDFLANLAAEALTENRSGKTKILDPELL